MIHEPLQLPVVTEGEARYQELFEVGEVDAAEIGFWVPAPRGVGGKMQYSEVWRRWREPDLWEFGMKMRGICDRSPTEWWDPVWLKCDDVKVQHTEVAQELEKYRRRGHVVRNVGWSFLH